MSKSNDLDVQKKEFQAKEPAKDNVLSPKAVQALKEMERIIEEDPMLPSSISLGTPTLGIYKALFDFQQEIEPVVKSTKGHHYKYADLPTVVGAIKPLLKKNNLGYYQALNGNNIKTVIFHTESGQTIESDTHMPFEALQYVEVKKTRAVKAVNPDGTSLITHEPYTTTVLQGFEGMNLPQAQGALISYFRRYALSSILGIVSDEDTDGTGKVETTSSSRTKSVDDLMNI